MVIPLNKTKEISDDSCSENVKETIQQNKTYVQKDLYDWSESTQVCTLNHFSNFQSFIPILASNKF